MGSIKNGIVIRMPDSSITKENSLGKIICDRIKSYIPMGYKLFIVELSEKDIENSTEVTEAQKERFLYYLEDIDIRLAFYIKKLILNIPRLYSTFILSTLPV